MRSLIARKAIPEARVRFFNDPEYNIGGHGRSRREVFEKNGTRGEEIFRHPNFLKHLHYFLLGARLQAGVVAAFEGMVAECGHVTSGDVVPLGAFARQQTRAYRLQPAEASEEFYKLALDLNLGQSYASAIRDAVRRAR